VNGVNRPRDPDRVGRLGAGAINAAVGSGTLITFPTVVALDRISWLAFGLIGCRLLAV
jgi:hypothetical protein